MEDPGTGSGPQRGHTIGSVPCDRSLPSRVERAIVGERRAFALSTSAERIEAGILDVAGGCAVYTGHGLFSNRVLGLGLDRAVTDHDLSAIERFYGDRGVGAEIELASEAAPALVDLVGRRHYRLRRFRNIYAQPTPFPSSPPPHRFDVAVVDESSQEAWSAALVEGFERRHPEAVRLVEEWNRALLATPGLTALIARVDGEVVAAASVFIGGAFAVLGGAATVPRHRRSGAHLALIAARLDVASRAGCDLAVVTADPGSISARNSERSGFQLVCTHAVMASPGPGYDPGDGG